MSAIPTLRDISVLIIALQVFVILLVPAAFYYLIIRGIGWAQRQVKTYGPRARGAFRQVALATEDASHKVAAPVIVVSCNAARVRRIGQAVRSTFAKKEV